MRIHSNERYVQHSCINFLFQASQQPPLNISALEHTHIRMKLWRSQKSFWQTLFIGDDRTGTAAAAADGRERITNHRRCDIRDVDGRQRARARAVATFVRAQWFCFRNIKRDLCASRCVLFTTATASAAGIGCVAKMRRKRISKTNEYFTSLFMQCKKYARI